MQHGAKRGRTARRAAEGAPDATLRLFSDLCDDVHRHFFNLARDPLAPSAAFAFGSASHALRAATSVVRAQFRADCEPAWVLAKKAGKASLKALIEARVVEWDCSGLRVDELALLGTLAPSLPALETLTLYKLSHEDALCFFEALGDAASPVAELCIDAMEYDDDDDDARGNTVAQAYGAALDRGAFPKLKHVRLTRSGIGDAGLVALAPALRRRRALREIDLDDNPLGDAGIAALVGPGPGSLAALDTLTIRHTAITDAGCAALENALNSGALSQLQYLRAEPLPRASPVAQERIFVCRGYRSGTEMRHEDTINALGDDEDDEPGYEPTEEEWEFYHLQGVILDEETSDDDEF